MGSNKSNDLKSFLVVIFNGQKKFRLNFAAGFALVIVIEIRSACPVRGNETFDDSLIRCVAYTFCHITHIQMAFHPYEL